MDRFWSGARDPLHLLPIVISGMENPKAQVLNGAMGMTLAGYTTQSGADTGRYNYRLNAQVRACLCARVQCVHAFALACVLA